MNDVIYVQLFRQDPDAGAGSLNQWNKHKSTGNYKP